MIFKQIAEILSGEKTQTRRVQGARQNYAVGHSYAVVPKRGKRAVWWKEYVSDERFYELMKNNNYTGLRGGAYSEIEDDNETV